MVQQRPIRKDLLLPIGDDDEVPEEEGSEDLVPEGKLVCVLTGEYKTASPQEETLQSFIEQLHREYGIALEDMGGMSGCLATTRIPGRVGRKHATERSR